MSTFSVKILSFESVVYEADALSVTIPSQKGYLSVMKDHVPLGGQLEKGRLHVHVPVDKSKLKTEEQNISFDVEEGFYEMSESGCVIYLTASLANLETVSH